MTSIPVLLRMALRYSLCKTINVFAAFVILLSITCLFTVNAVLKGIEEEWRQLIRGSKADVVLEWPAGRPELSDVEKRMPKDVVWSPVIRGFGLIRTPRFIAAVSLKGIDPEREKRLRDCMGLRDLGLGQLAAETEKSPLSGVMGLFGSGGGGGTGRMLVGCELANELSLCEDESVELSIPNCADGVSTARFTVGGVFRSGFYEDDRGLVITRIGDAEKLVLSGAGFSQIQAADSGGPPGGLRDRLEKAFPGADAKAWYELQPVSLKALRNQRIIVVLLLSLLILVSSFGILAIQWNFVREKVPDIGVLRAVGFSAGDVFAVFLGVSWIVGLVGLVAGLGLGIVTSHYAGDLVALTGWDPFPSDIYYHEGLPAKIELFDVVWIGALSLSMTTLAGFLPAWHAVRIKPIDAIRQL